MPLVTVNIPEKLGLSLLSLLERLVTAVERIAGPQLQYKPPVPATLKDYAYVPPEEAERIRLAQEEFGAQHMLVPGSPAYLAAIEEFERQVASACGEDAVNELPWRVQTGNPPAEEPK